MTREQRLETALEASDRVLDRVQKAGCFDIGALAECRQLIRSALATPQTPVGEAQDFHDIAVRIISEADIPYVPESDSVEELDPHWDPLIHAISVELARASASRIPIPDGSVMLADGRVVRVLGERLPMTGDNYVAGIGAKVFNPMGAEWNACVRDYAHEPGAIEDDPNCLLIDCFSSREAALAARRPSDAEGETK